MFHHQRSRHHHPVPIRDPSSFVLWFLVGIALISLVFTTRQAAASRSADRCSCVIPCGHTGTLIGHSNGVITPF
jgi:hypothetical protein